MNRTTNPVRMKLPGKKLAKQSVRKKSRWNLGDESWGKKGVSNYVLVSRDSMNDESNDFEAKNTEVFIVPKRLEDETISRSKVVLIQVKLSDFLKVSEIVTNVPKTLATQARITAASFYRHLRLTMPEIKFNDVRVTLVKKPGLEMPKLTAAFPKQSKGFTYQASAIQKLLAKQFATLLSEAEPHSKAGASDSWLDQPAALLDRLESDRLSKAETQKAIAHAESLTFSEDQRLRLLKIYDRFIETSRFTEDEDEITVVCSAIRKYAMNMGADRLDKYAGWIVPTSNQRVNHDVELELCKGAYWHLRYLDSDCGNGADAGLRQLRAVVADVASDYLKPRLMLDKNYASIEKFAVLACVLIDARLGESEISTRLWSGKAALSMGWFDRLVKFESDKALIAIAKRDERFAAKVSKLFDSLNREGE